MNFFDRKPCNLDRQPEVDDARGMAALIIIVCHVGLYLGDSANKGVWTFSDIIGSEFCAPVLMALMGISMVYSRIESPKEMFLRGIDLFLLGYALNFFRSILPLMILGPVDEWASIKAFFVVDILPFAGLSFMVIALFKKWKLSNIVILAIAIIMVIMNQFLMLPDTVPWKSELLTGIVNLFCPTTEWSCFPFLTWFIFPAFGLVFGDLLMHCRSKETLYGILLPAGLLGVIYVYGRFYILYPDYRNYYWGNNFYYMGLKNAMLTILFLCFALSFWFFAGKILPEFIKKFLGFLSINLNTFYIISWIIISILMHMQAIYKWKLSASATIALMVLLNAVCALLTKMWLPVKRKIHRRSL